MKKILLTLLCGAAFLLMASSDVFACSCRRNLETVELEEEVKTDLKEAKAVFSGKVLSSAKDPKSYFMRVRFKVDRTWKGVTTEIVTIYTGRGGPDCGIRFAVGESYLVYAYSENKQRLSTNICTRTTGLAKAGEDLKILGEGTPVKKKNERRRTEK